MTTTEEWGKSDKMVVLPLLFDTPKGYKILMGEQMLVIIHVYL